MWRDHGVVCKDDADVVYFCRFFPDGWSGVAKKWDGLCSYTAAANGNHALCNVPTNTHSWQAPSSKYKTFMCGTYQGAPFTGTLGSRNGVPARQYNFQIVKASASSGRYSDVMIKDCAKIGMKPICDHKSYCKSDVNSIYIGQDHHIAYAGHRNNGGCVSCMAWMHWMICLCTSSPCRLHFCTVVSNKAGAE